jgi:hypothetical protein
MSAQDEEPGRPDESLGSQGNEPELEAGAPVDFFRRGSADDRAAQAALQDEADAAAMFYRMSAARLRSRCLLAGLVLMASILIPYEVIGGRGIFVWSVLPELGTAAKIAALSPAIAGLFLFLLGLRPKGREGLVIERPTSRAIAVLGAFVAVNGVLLVGRDSSAWGVLPLPDSLTTRPAPFLAVFALTAAGVVLRFHPRARKGGTALLLASLASALVFYLWPSRGEIPAQTIGRAIISVATLSDARFQIGYGMILLFVLAPLVVALLGLAYVARVPSREHPGLAILAVWAVPGMMLLFVYRAFITGGAGVQTIATAFFALLILAVVGPLASALEVLAIGVTMRDPEAELLGGASPAVAGAVASALVTGLLVTSYVLGRPAPKGVDWKLASATPEWDKVYGELLPRWQVARLVRDSHARSDQGTGAEAQVATKGRARDMLAAIKARPEGKDVLAAMESLASDVDDLELSGRAFGRLVAEANDAARRAELPYYLDPEIRIRTTEQATTRIFHMTPYRVQEVHGWKVGGARFATLLVDAMTGDHHVHLGFSRDQDPFALVERSEITWYSERLAKGEETCGHGRDGVSAPNVARCDAALKKQKDLLGAGLERAVLSGTERHELQHQIDGPHLVLSSALAEMMAGYADEAQDRANRELSAYVAEMTAKEAPPQLALIHLFPFGMASRGGAEHRVAILLLETLSGKKLRLGAREIEPDAYAEAFEEQVSRPDADLRESARRAWRAHFGAELPEPIRE